MKHNIKRNRRREDAMEPALALARACDPYDDASPLWLGTHYPEEQYQAMEKIGKKHNLILGACFTAYEKYGPGIQISMRSLLALAKEYDLTTLLVPTRRHLATHPDEPSPTYWEKRLAKAQIKIVEAPPKNWR